MAEEAAVAPAGVVSPAPPDHKRKLEDLEANDGQHPPLDLNADSEADATEEKVGEAYDAKRPRFEDNTDGDLADENGYKVVKDDEAAKEESEQEQPSVENAQLEDAKDSSNDAPEVVNNEPSTANDHEVGNAAEPSDPNPQQDAAEQPSETELNEPSTEIPQPEDDFSEQQQPASDTETISRNMEVPNNKVGVLIGKAGDTIRFLQYNSGAKIQITRDAEANPHSATRPVELIGTLENIIKAEKLIKDVIAEADAGGSPSLVARGFGAAQATGAGEQLQIQVPNEKVGLIIGKGGETIKSLQTRSGARIQLIPQHLPEGDQSKERTVRVTGDRKQIEMAREMIKEVMNQPVRPSPLSSGYNQHTYRPRGSSGPPHWGPRGPHPAHPMAYDYQHRGPHPSHGAQYPPSTYGSYPPQQLPPRSSFGSGWEQRPPAAMQGPPHGNYDYYGGPGGGHLAETPASAPISNPIAGHVPGSVSAMNVPAHQANYNYGQPQGADYGQPAPYSQSAPQQGYGHGYEEPKYDNMGATQHPYGGHGNSQPVYQQSSSQPGYSSQQQYGRPPSYSMQSQGPPPQSFGPPRASQPGDMPYQGPVPSTQSYGSNVPSQQSYPYASSGSLQQTYPPYGSAPVTDGYNQPPTASAPGYTQQAAPPVSGYGQPGGQPASGYAQGGSQGGYGSYPSAQPGYNDQAAPNTAGYGYQGTVDPGYNSGSNSVYGAAPSGQPGYAQPLQTQATYDQSVPQPGGYGAAPIGYGKSLSPQPGYPQYDSSQMYGAR